VPFTGWNSELRIRAGAQFHEVTLLGSPHVPAFENILRSINAALPPGERQWYHGGGRAVPVDTSGARRATPVELDGQRRQLTVEDVLQTHGPGIRRVLGVGGARDMLVATGDARGAHFVLFTDARRQRGVLLELASGEAEERRTPANAGVFRVRRGVWALQPEGGPMHEFESQGGTWTYGFLDSVGRRLRANVSRLAEAHQK
jgi:hypothetical protein